jgi:hypothetical protein
MAEVCLDSARVRPVIGKLVAAGMAQHVGVNRMIESSLDAGPRHKLGDTVPRKRAAAPAGEHKRQAGSCSRFNRRSARSSRPDSGCTLGSPFLPRRTCVFPRSRSTSAQRNAMASEARNPCRNMTRRNVPSRWPWRLPEVGQPFDFRFGEVFARAQPGIRLAAVANCPHFVGWR